MLHHQAAAGIAQAHQVGTVGPVGHIQEMRAASGLNGSAVQAAALQVQHLQRLRRRRGGEGEAGEGRRGVGADGHFRSCVLLLAYKALRKGGAFGPGAVSAVPAVAVGKQHGHINGGRPGGGAGIPSEIPRFRTVGRRNAAGLVRDEVADFLGAGLGLYRTYVGTVGFNRSAESHAGRGGAVGIAGDGDGIVVIWLEAVGRNIRRDSDGLRAVANGVVATGAVLVVRRGRSAAVDGRS